MNGMGKSTGFNDCRGKSTGFNDCRVSPQDLMIGRGKSTEFSDWVSPQDFMIVKSKSTGFNYW